MQDLKLYTEILHAVDHGITTTNKKALDWMYRSYDKNPTKVQAFSEPLDFAFDQISAMKFLARTNLVKPYMLYSLALALIDSKRPIPNLEPFEIAIDFDSISFERRMLALSAALDLDDEEARESSFQEFIAASRERTNVKAQRQTRVRWFINALSGAEI
jgi:hypothetical protein